MKTMRMGALLAQRIAFATHWPPLTAGVSKYNWQKLMSNTFMDELNQTSKHFTWWAGQLQQRSAVPASMVAELRGRLQFTSDRALRQFWRRSGVRLDAARATNALQVLTLLEREGVPPTAVRRHPGLLNVSQARLSEQLSCLRRLPAPIGDIFPLLLLRPDQLQSAVIAARDDVAGTFPDAPSRLHYLADQLQTDMETLCVAVNRNPLILSAPPRRIIEITRLMIDGGIPRHTILDDPYIYNHNVDVMHERLEWVHRVQLQPLRPWMLRCAEHTLREHVERFQLRLSILSEHGDEVTYLSERLGLSRAQVSAFQHRHPPVLRVSVMKMKDVLDVLLAYGISGEQVASQPRILCYSARRIRERCERLRAAGLRPISLLVLWKTPREFERYMAAATAADITTDAGGGRGETGQTVDGHSGAAA